MDKHKHKGYTFVDEVSANDTVETVAEPVNETKSAVGIVNGCVTLNVRSAPNVKAKVITTVNEGDKLEVDETGVHGDFYKVYTAAGISGYCMKKYVAVLVD